MQGVEKRGAKFRTVVALIIDGEENLFEGECIGNITKAKSGKEGFGYDPIFMPNSSGKTFAEMRKDEKGVISHRGKAIKKLVRFLSTN